MWLKDIDRRPVTVELADLFRFAVESVRKIGLVFRHEEDEEIVCFLRLFRPHVEPVFAGDRSVVMLRRVLAVCRTQRVGHLEHRDRAHLAAKGSMHPLWSTARDYGVHLLDGMAIAFVNEFVVADIRTRA